MRPRLALATYDGAPLLARDDRQLVAALSAVGIDAEPAVWSAEDLPWEIYDAVVIRSCWDYHVRRASFRAWLERLDAGRVPVWNSVALVGWNSHKRYLIDLERRGVPIVPTQLIRGNAAADGIWRVETIAEVRSPREATNSVATTVDPVRKTVEEADGADTLDADVAAVAAVASAVESAGWSRVVVKPAVSASGFETHALDAPIDAAGRAAIARIAAIGDVLVQPFVVEVPRDGELSLVFIDGAFSHAAIKRAAPAEFRVQTEHGGSVAPVEVEPWIVDAGAAALRALPEVPLYARVDGVARDGVFLLMELELIEPNLFMELAPGSAERIARAVSARLR